MTQEQKKLDNTRQLSFCVHRTTLRLRFPGPYCESRQARRQTSLRRRVAHDGAGDGAPDGAAEPGSEPPAVSPRTR